MRSPTWLRILIVALVLLAATSTVLSYWWGAGVLQAAANLAVVLSLAGLLVYAYHTYLLARDAWTPSASFAIKAYPDSPYHFAFILQNHCKFSLNCWCKLNATVYGQPVSLEGFYGGNTSFDVQPFGAAMGHFDLRDLLAKSSRTIEEMKQKASPDNVRQQLRFDIRFSYNPVGSKPRTENVPQPHYFDFKSDVLVADF